MRVTIHLWAQIRVAAGTPHVTVELTDGTRVGEALVAFDAAYPHLAPLRASARAAVGSEYAEADQILKDGDQVSLIPPVQGG